MQLVSLRFWLTFKPIFFCPNCNRLRLSRCRVFAGFSAEKLASTRSFRPFIFSTLSEAPSRLSQRRFLRFNYHFQRFSESTILALHHSRVFPIFEISFRNLCIIAMMLNFRADIRYFANWICIKTSRNDGGVSQIFKGFRIIFRPFLDHLEKPTKK